MGNNNKTKNKEWAKLDLQQDFLNDELHHLLSPIREMEKTLETLSSQNFRNNSIIEIAEEMKNKILDNNYVDKLSVKIAELKAEIAKNDKSIDDLAKKINEEKGKIKHITEPLEIKTMEIIGILGTAGYFK